LKSSAANGFISSKRMMMARFLAVDDPNVVYTIVRDPDSRLNFRELMAVNEWIATGLEFHSVRDHRLNLVPVMGGLFSMRLGLFGNTTLIGTKGNERVPKKDSWVLW
jgi:hypothetical protein